MMRCTAIDETMSSNVDAESESSESSTSDDGASKSSGQKEIESHDDYYADSPDENSINEV